MTPPPEPSSYLDQGSGENLRTQLEALTNSYYAKIVESGNTAAWDADQLALQSQINVLAEQLGVDVDPQVITGNDEFARPSAPSTNHRSGCTSTAASMNHDDFVKPHSGPRPPSPRTRNTTRTRVSDHAPNSGHSQQF